MAIEAVAVTEPSSPGTMEQRFADRLAQSFDAEERAGRILALRGRTVALVAIMGLLLVVVPFPDVVFYELLIGIFIALGFLGLWLDQAGLYRWWHGYMVSAVDFALLAFTLVVPNPLASVELPPQMTLRSGNFVYFYVLLVGLAFSLQPRQVLWGGAMGALAWSAAAGWVVFRPDTVFMPDAGETSAEAMIAGMSLPTFLDLNALVRDIAVFIIIAALLSLVVSRSRRLARRQARLERERANLARHFPPATVDRLASQDAALAQIREQETAVLFADLVGFTRWAERHGPVEVIGLLREVHARFEEAVFRHDGTLDKFIGDGMMATFGTPDRGPRDASNALACLIAILAEFDEWNGRRRHAGKEAIRVSIGIHYGPVVMGNIGTERRLEFTVLGDTVNVASRLESLTRELRCKAVISAALADAALDEPHSQAADDLARFSERGTVRLRGRDEEVAVLTYG